MSRNWHILLNQIGIFIIVLLVSCDSHVQFQEFRFLEPNMELSLRYVNGSLSNLDLLMIEHNEFFMSYKSDEVVNEVLCFHTKGYDEFEVLGEFWMTNLYGPNAFDAFMDKMEQMNILFVETPLENYQYGESIEQRFQLINLDNDMMFDCSLIKGNFRIVENDFSLEKSNIIDRFYCDFDEEKGLCLVVGYTY